jgi:hypothetical protein
LAIDRRERDLPFPLSISSRSIIEGHFKRKGLKWEEDFFLDMLASANRHDVYFAVIALRDCGTDRSVGPLKGLLHHPMQDVKATSILTIAQIAGARETAFYAEALLDPAYSQKIYALWAMNDCADERAADAVLQYFKRNRSRIKSGKFDLHALNHGIDYLRRIRGTSADFLEFLDFLGRPSATSRRNAAGD